MLVASVSPDVLSLAERMYIYPGTWYAATNMFSTIFSIFSQKDHQKQLSFQPAELTVQLTYPTSGVYQLFNHML